MTTFATPIGTVRYAGNNGPFIVAVPSGTKLGTTVIKRTSKREVAFETFRRTRAAVIVNNVTGEIVAAKTGSTP